MIGTDSFSDWTVAGEAVSSALASAGIAAASSVRSLFLPGRVKARVKFFTTGVAVFSSGRSFSSSSVSDFVVGREAFTSDSSASG